MGAISWQLIAALVLFSVSSALLFSAANIANTPKSQGGTGPETASPMLQSLGCLIGAVTLLPFVLVTYFGMTNSWLGAFVLFAILVATAWVARELALVFVTRFPSVGILASVGLVGIIACGYWAWASIPIAGTP